jgi:hypothetical protein
MLLQSFVDFLTPIPNVINVDVPILLVVKESAALFHDALSLSNMGGIEIPDVLRKCVVGHPRSNLSQ